MLWACLAATGGTFGHLSITESTMNLGHAIRQFSQAHKKINNGMRKKMMKVLQWPKVQTSA